MTLRKWETNGWLPPAVYVLRSRISTRGNRRFYSRPQVAGLVRIMEEENLTDPTSRRTNIAETKFEEKAHELWRKLASEG